MGQYTRYGLSINSNSVYQDFVNYEIDGAFWRMVAQGTGYHEPDVDLGRFAMHILLTASITSWMHGNTSVSTKSSTINFINL